MDRRGPINVLVTLWRDEPKFPARWERFVEIVGPESGVSASQPAYYLMIPPRAWSVLPSAVFTSWGRAMRRQ